MKNNLFYPIVLLLMVSAIVLTSCGKSGSGYGSSNTPPASGNAVSMVNMSFSPANLTVTAGTTVTWTNNDAMNHTVTSNSGLFDSGNIAAGAKFSKQFSTAGSYPYHCTIHAGMTGTITVK
jgi:plastocyanin